MVSSMLGAVVRGLGSSAKTVIGRTSQIAARVNLHIHPLCSGVRLLVNGQKMSAALGARLTLPENGKGSVASGTLLPST